MNGGLEGRYVKYTRVGAYVEGDMGSIPPIFWMFGPEKERNGWIGRGEWATGLLIT